MSIISYDKDDRVMIFIDLRNMTKSIRMDANFAKLDFVALARLLKGSRKLVAAYIFDSKGVMESEGKSKRFHDYLRYNGFRVIARDSYDSERDEQKEVDVAMACQIVVHALRDNYDVGIVVSGDRDFIPAIQEAQSAGKRIEVAAFEGTVAEEMRRAADNFHRLETLPLLSMTNMTESMVVDSPVSAGSDDAVPEAE